MKKVFIMSIVIVVGAIVTVGVDRLLGIDFGEASMFARTTHKLLLMMCGVVILRVMKMKS